MKTRLQNDKGFTFIEILMVIVILSILFQMALTFFKDLRTRSYDTVAITDGKNLITAVGNTFVLLEDVDYTHNAGDGSGIGTLTTSGAPRSTVFKLSPGVQAIIFGESRSTPGASSVSAYLWHENGTDDAGSLSGNGKREFYFAIDEATSTISVPELKSR